MFIYLLPDGHLGCFNFWLLWIKLLWKPLVQVISEDMFCFVFNFPWISTKDYNCWIIFMCKFVKNCQFHDMFRCYSPTSKEWDFYEESSSLSTLSIVRFSMKVAMKRYLIVLLSCISLMMEVLSFSYTSYIWLCEVSVQFFCLFLGEVTKIVFFFFFSMVIGILYV